MRDDPDMDDDELRRRLADLGGRLAFPPTPDIAAATGRRISAGRRRTTRADWMPRGTAWRRTVLPLGGALLVLLVVAVRSPAEGLADRFGLRGVRLFFLDEVPTAVPAPAGSGLRLGRRTSLPEAEDAVDFDLLLPRGGPLGQPDDVYVSAPPSEGMVSFVYRPRADLPESPYAGVGALLSEFRGLVDDPVASKGVPPNASVEAVAIGGGRGYWIEGEAHLFLLRDPSGEVRYEEYRLAGNVLLWERGELTLRLESALSKEEALAIAASMEPVADSPRGTDGG